MHRLLTVALLVTLTSCDDDELLFTTLSEEGAVPIRVVNTEGEPVGGATLSGGDDWQRWEVRTEADGVAGVPLWAVQLETRARIVATSHFPTEVELRPGGEYELEATPLQLRVVDRIRGNAIRFRGDTVTTLSAGILREYTYDSDAVELLRERLLIDRDDGFAISPGIRGDTLWVLTVLSGTYPRDAFVRAYTPAFGAGDPFAEREVPGAGWITLRDSVIVVGGEHRDDGEILLANGDEPLNPLATLPQSDHGFFVQDVLVLGSFSGGHHLTPVDLNDPTAPLEMHGISAPGTEGLVFWGDTLLAGPARLPQSYPAPPPARYRVLDFSDPRHPVEGGVVESDAYLEEVDSKGWAFGAWAGNAWTPSLLRWDGNRFRLLSTLSEGTGRSLLLTHRADPPHYWVEGSLMVEDPVAEPAGD